MSLGRGSLVPELRGKARNMSMNNFLAGLIASDSDGDEESQWNPYDENDPSCCSSRRPKNEADFPFAQLHTQDYARGIAIAAPQSVSLDQFLQGMIDDASESEEEQQPAIVPAASSSETKPAKKVGKKTASKKVTIKEEPKVEEKKEVEEEQVAAAAVEEIPKGKGRKRTASTTRKRKQTSAVEEVSSSKKPRPTPPSSPSVGSDVEK